MMRWYGSVCGAILLIFLGVGSGIAGVFNPESFVLGNGMRVVVVPNHRVPVVSHMVWYRVGAADEAAGKSGVAHLFEHLMFKGTPTWPNGQFSQIVARHGGQENAFTSSDYTGYYQTVAVDRLGLVMEMEADRMRNLILTQKELDTERLVVLEERGQRMENNPAAILGEHVNAALFMNYPYRIPVIGWEHEIKALAIKDLRDFYQHWYVPNNAILVVAGDITAAQLRPLAEKYYGVIPRGAEIVRLRPSEPPQRASRRVELRDARVAQPVWRRLYLAPSASFGRTEQALPLEVLAEAFGGSASGPLYRRLVIERKLAVSAGAHYDADALGPSAFTVYASPKPGVSLAELETAVDQELDDLLSNGVDPKAVARATKRMRDEAVFARDSLTAGARILGAALSIGRTIEDVESWPDRVAVITPAQIDIAAKAVLRRGGSVTAALLPETTN